MKFEGEYVGSPQPSWDDILNQSRFAGIDKDIILCLAALLFLILVIGSCYAVKNGQARRAYNGFLGSKIATGLALWSGASLSFAFCVYLFKHSGYFRFKRLFDAIGDNFLALLLMVIIPPVLLFLFQKWKEKFQTKTSACKENGRLAIESQPDRPD